MRLLHIRQDVCASLGFSTYLPAYKRAMAVGRGTLPFQRVNVLTRFFRSVQLPYNEISWADEPIVPRSRWRRHGCSSYCLRYSGF